MNHHLIQLFLAQLILAISLYGCGDEHDDSQAQIVAPMDPPALLNTLIRVVPFTNDYNLCSVDGNGSSVSTGKDLNSDQVLSGDEVEKVEIICLGDKKSFEINFKDLTVKDAG